MIDKLDVNHIKGSSALGKSVIYIDLANEADFSIYECTFEENVLMKTIMFNLKSKVWNFLISDCQFINETL